MYKKISFIFSLSLLLFLTGCASTSRYDFEQKKMVKDTYCHGRSNSWETCYSNAKTTCPKGYTVIKQDNGHVNLGQGALGALAWEGLHSMTNGKDGSRHLVFVCKQ
jgi:hypothetical protein